LECVGGKVKGVEGLACDLALEGVQGRAKGFQTLGESGGELAAQRRDSLFEFRVFRHLRKGNI